MIAAFQTILTYVVMLTYKQKPVIGKTNLDSAAVPCCVPQGGIMNPLLFVCYVHDMAISFDQDCKSILIICLLSDSRILFLQREEIANTLEKDLENPNIDWLVVISCHFILTKQNA